MAIQLPQVIPNHASHVITLWMDEECFKFFVQQRRANCNFKERLDLVFIAPYCERCYEAQTCSSRGIPDISPHSWEEDLRWCVGGNTLRRVKKALKRDDDPVFQCKRCRTELRPWEGDDVHVITETLENLYSVPLCPPGRVNASKKLKARIVE